MNRREVLKTTLAASGALALGAARSAHGQAPRRGFHLKYAPHFGMFKASAGEDLLDQLKFAADQGFTAWEDNGMASKPAELQEKIAKEMARLGITMGVFVAMADFQNVTFASTKPEIVADIVAKAKAAVEVARRVNAKWTTVVPGRYDVGLEWDYQTANVLDNLKRCIEVMEPAGLVMVLEPLNAWKDHPGLFLTKVPQAYQICRSLGSPSCKILFDMYHQQITEGNIIPNIDRAWSEVAYMQVGDNPGRKEPTTGEMNYKNIFRHLNEKGFAGVVGMEHGNSKPGVEGEKAVIEAYRYSDTW
jgi:hydroxypyruvate isomerase